MKKKISLCGGCKSKGHPHRCFICGNHNVIVYYCDKYGRIIQGDVYGLNKKTSVWIASRIPALERECKQ